MLTSPGTFHNTLFWYAHTVAYKKVIWCRGRLGLCKGCQEGQEVKEIQDLGHYEKNTLDSLPAPWQALEWVDTDQLIIFVSGETLKVKPIKISEIFTKCIKEVPRVDGSE